MSDVFHVRRDMHNFDIPYLSTYDIQSYYDHVWEDKDFRNHEVRVAHNRQGPVGFAGFDVQGRVMRLLRLAVNPTKRRLGIGTQLIKYLQAEAADTNIRRISVVLRETNSVGCMFLRKNGFKAVHTMREHFGDEGGIFFKWQV